MRTGPLIALALAGLLAAGPAWAQTAMVDVSGKEVSTLLMRYKINTRSSPTDRHVLLRDVTRDHYLITLDEPCMSLKFDQGFSFRPPIEIRARASERYDLLFANGRDCRITKIQQVASKKAGIALAESELAAALAAEAAAQSSQTQGAPESKE